MKPNLGHHLQWDTARIATFWSYIAQSESHQKDYFAKQVGAGIVKFLTYLVALHGRILDFGCGPGYLTENLVRSGIACEGCDTSEESVNLVNKKFSRSDLWGGAKVIMSETLPYQDNTFDLIICLETIEHLLDRELGKTLDELYRILKPETGRLFITTPDNEDLELSEVFCPECGAIYHRYQHVRKFTQNSLSGLMASHGFKTELSDVTLFNSFQEPFIKSPLSWSLDYLPLLTRRLFSALRDLVKLPNGPIRGYRFEEYLSKGPHLFWLGVK
jgi:2-polyprenyl-3-methyl-5-hydroxy-6-metoxy-1,4-benzoquinol methylase